MTINCHYPNISECERMHLPGDILPQQYYEVHSSEMILIRMDFSSNNNTLQLLNFYDRPRNDVLLR